MEKLGTRVTRLQVLAQIGGASIHVTDCFTKILFSATQ